MALISGSMTTRRESIAASLELESNAQPGVAEDGAGDGAGGVPDDVIDVGDARREEVLPRFDRGGERESEKNRQHVRLHGRTIDRVERDEGEESPRQEQQDVADDRDENQRQDLRRDRPVLDAMGKMPQVLERNRID